MQLDQKALEAAMDEIAHVCREKDVSDAVTAYLSALTPPDVAGLKPAGWFNPWNDFHGYQQVAKEYEARKGTIPLYGPEAASLIQSQAVELAADKARIAGLIAAWDALPEGYHTPRVVEEWLQNTMKPVFEDARSLLNGERKG